MSRLHPALRTGLICAGLHQAFALCGLAALWVSVGLFQLFGILLLVADFASFWVLTALLDAIGLSDWRPAFLNSLRNHLPAEGRTFAEAIVFVLTVGALQWLLIGGAIGLYHTWRFKVTR